MHFGLNWLGFNQIGARSGANVRADFKKWFSSSAPILMSGRLAIAFKGAYLWHNAAPNIRGTGGWGWPGSICLPQPG